jgi:hypothetical protein
VDTANDAAGPLAVPCDACGAVIDGSCIVDHMRALHPWCWTTERRAHDEPGMYAVAADLAKRERRAEG